MSSIRILSKSDVEQVTGILARRLTQWIANGIVPGKGGEGRGNHRRFSLMEVVGIAIAWELYISDRGCALSYAKAVIEAFAKSSPEELEKRFESDGIRLATVKDDRIWLSGEGERWGWVNVKEVLHGVMSKAEKMMARVPDRQGRRTGLVS